ncbi:MAG: 2,4-dihydroxyhept-2-ene,7-dioic acid aldolase [Actinomycetia bacterium]|nr:2,4-dihydroxyhept-2-ene,7-dioic acid aldolase [Actinomycetes bacterium]
MAFGVFCALDGYAVSHLFASVGYDFVIIDLQHAAYTWPEIENMCFRIRSEGAAVFLRTASTEPAEVNLALDLPIDGVVLPNISSLAEARAAVAQTKFPPDGERSLGNERHDTIWQAYDAPEPLVGMLVEHKGAVAEIEQIFSELPIDFAWIGTHDLSASMGFDPHDVVAGGKVPPELTVAIDRIRAAARASGVRFWAAEPGADATITGVDARIVRQAALDALHRTRDRLQPRADL